MKNKADLIFRVLFAVFLIAANYLPVASTYSELLLIMAVIFISMPEILQIRAESMEKGKFVLNKKHAFSMGVSVVCVAFILVFSYFWHG